ncbi:MAG: J domain-containing protein, partial [Planctomycetota bacterium]|nr:J domain-containing protein [Planctomycetota bacterium]
MSEDYYKTLGIRRDASHSEIQDAYRDMARKYHPDVNPDDEAAAKKFQEVQAAFDVLNDQKKRELYDRYGSSFESMGAEGPQGAGGWGGAWPGGGPGGPGGGPGGFNAENIDFSQFFGERFGAQGGAGVAGGAAGPGGAGGGGFADFFSQFTQAGAGQPQARGRRRRQRGMDITHDLTITFETAIKGGKVQLAVQRHSGKTETITVTVPAGIDSGKKIRLRGQGEPSPSGDTAGDIILTIHVTAHKFFQRHGNNLQVRVPVTLAEAASGAKVDVPTPRGTVSLQVPAGTSSGAKLRIKGHGVERKGAKAGDLLAEIQIVLPKDL